MVAGGLQPVWTSGCRERRSRAPHGGVRKRRVTVRACAPSAGRLTVTLKRRGVRVARRTVTTRRGRIVAVRFPTARPAAAVYTRQLRFRSRSL